MKAGISSALRFLFPLLSMLFFWELAVSLGLFNPSLLPTPSMIAGKLLSLIYPKPILLDHLSSSVYRLLAGFSLGATLGILLGILMGLNRIAYRSFQPLVSVFVSIPTLAWVPLLLIIVGIGEATIIFAIFLGAFFPVVYNTMNGIALLDHRYIWASEMMGAGNIAKITKVIIPGSLVSILTGLKLAVGYSWRALVGAEMLAAASSGVGYMIYASRAFYDVNAMFAGLCLIALGGLFMDWIVVKQIEKYTIKQWGVV